MLRSLAILVAATIFLFLVAYFRRGDFSLVADGLARSWDMGCRIIPILVVALIMAGMIQVVVPAETTAKLLGPESGSKGLLLASLLGAVTPGGPTTTFSIAAAFHKAGADIAPIAAFIFAWSMTGIYRTIILEVPIMGSKFAFSRIAVGLLFAPLLGLLTGFIFQITKQ